MQFEPPPAPQAFIDRAIANGRYRSADEAVQDALARWEQNERMHIEALAAFDEAESDVLAGHLPGLHERDDFPIGGRT